MHVEPVNNSLGKEIELVALRFVFRSIQNYVNRLGTPLEIDPLIIVRMI
jgi:hypothetical protein